MDPGSGGAVPDTPLNETETRALKRIAGAGGSCTYAGDIIHELPSLSVLVELSDRGLLRFVRRATTRDEAIGETLRRMGSKRVPALIERVELTDTGWIAIGEDPPGERTSLTTQRPRP